MNWILIISYLIIILIAGFGATVILTGFLSFLILLPNWILPERWRVNTIFIAWFLSGLCVWFLINSIWSWVNGENMSVLCFFLCFMALGQYHSFQKEHLTELSIHQITQERWAVLVFAIYIHVQSDVIWV
jgi:hypothetical protein